MSTSSQPASPRVSVAPDKSSAELLIPADFDRALLSPALIDGLLREAGLEVTEQVQLAIHELLNQPTTAGQITRGIIAKARPPTHGCDAHIQWLVHKPEQQPANEEAAQSYYNRSAFIMVHAGDIVGQLHQATPGEDGRDVTGKTLGAKSGKPLNVRFDPSILLDPAGKLVAQAEGVLRNDDQTISIQKLLEISEYVDFSTGNINFHGDVIINRGIRDCFIVKTSGNVQVKGLIEAATIDCGGDLNALGGFAGRERGQARIGGSLHSRYLDNVGGEIGQDLCVDREIINCDLVVHGSVQSPRGAIIGGKLTVSGPVHIATLGSPAAVATELIVGSVPRLERLRHQLLPHFQRLSDQHQRLLTRLQEINKLAPRSITAQHKEEQTEFTYQLSVINPSYHKVRQTIENLQAQISRERTVELHVTKNLHAGVMLCCGDWTYHVHTDVRGPLTIQRNTLDQLLVKRGDSPAEPIKTIAVTKVSLR
jgi:hypothetical protein